MEPFVPPHCPNPGCRYHRQDRALWRFRRAGFYLRQARPQRIQRFHCDHCGRYFSTQTFSSTYWLRHPEWVRPLFHRLIGCSAFRQIAREFACSHTSLLLQAARLGRHAWLFHELHRPRTIAEPLCLDGFVSFEFSQYSPTAFHLAVGQHSHFLYGFTDSELRRSGRMTEAQKARRAELEARRGRPDPRSTEREVATLLRLIAPRPQALILHTDEHQDYPRAIRRVPHLAVDHHTISSRVARTPHHPLFPVNLLDLLLRHSGANHKRETIAFSKRRQGACERLAAFLLWRNYLKSVSELRRDDPPAIRLGLETGPRSLDEVFARRLFPTRIPLPARWQDYYWRRIRTRAFAHNREHRLRYAF
jgi:transposase-like protein